MGRSSNIVSVVEAAYAVGDTEEAWLDRIASAIEPDLAQGLGTLAYLYDASTNPIRLLTVVGRSSVLSMEVIGAVIASADESYVEATFRTMSFGANFFSWASQKLNGSVYHGGLDELE